VLVNEAYVITASPDYKQPFGGCPGGSFRHLGESDFCHAHTQPKKSAVPIFRRMLASHERSLAAARSHSDPAGQIAAREMEIVRIKGALQRAEELSDDVAPAIERAL
jgi:hypothetical protein